MLDQSGTGQSRHASTCGRNTRPIDAHVGKRVRLKRMLAGMSQEELAEHIGLSFQQIQKYENGINRIGAGRLLQLSQILGVSVQFFFEGAPLAKRVPEADPADAGDEDAVLQFVSTREGLELIRTFAEIEDPRIRKQIIELVRCIAAGQ